MNLAFWKLNFKPTFSLSSFTFFSSSSLSAIWMVSFTYLRLLIFLPAILILVCVSSSPAFHMIYSAYKVNEQGDNIQPWHTLFPILEQSMDCCSMSSPNCCFLTCIQVSKEAGKVVWYCHLLKNFPQFVVICSQSFGVVNKREVHVFLELSCFFYDPTDVCNLFSGSSSLSKSCLHIWQFTVHGLLKPHLENFEHYFASVWKEFNSLIVWRFFGIAFP